MDNVPGARGVGPKTALKLLGQYPTVEELLEHAEKIEPARASKSLLENADDVRQKTGWVDSFMCSNGEIKK